MMKLMQKFSLVFLLVLGLLWGGSVRFVAAADTCDLARDFAADAEQTFKTDPQEGARTATPDPG